MTKKKVKVRRRAPRRPADEPRRLAVALARSADEKLGTRTLVLDVRRVTNIADYLLITSATSAPHIRAIASDMEEAIRKTGGRLHHREGDHNSTWILLDCYSVIAHIFDEATRRFYDLERLWGDAKIIQWKSRKRGG